LDGLSRHQEGHALGLDGFFASHGPHAFAGLGFQADLFRGSLEDLGNPLTDGFPVRRQLRALGMDDAVDIGDLPTGLPHEIAGGAEHRGGIASAVGRIAIGEHLSDVAEGCGTQQGVGYRVEQRIRITVPRQFPIVGDINPAQPERTARPELVDIMSNSNPCDLRRSRLPLVTGDRVNCFPERIIAARRSVGKAKRESPPDSSCFIILSSLVVDHSPILGGAYNHRVMAVIEIQGLTKSYRVYQKREGLRASIGGLFRRR